jgi:hypothetical protein
MIKKVFFGLAVGAALIGIAAYGTSVKGHGQNVLADTGALAQVQTISATDITGSTAVLHGIANNAGGSMGHMWFEYGTSASSLTQKTSGQFMWLSNTYPDQVYDCKS